MGEIQQSVVRGMGIGMVAATGLVAVAMVGCDEIEKVVGTVAPPGADLREVNLVDHPSARELARWACHNLEIDFDAIGLDIPGLDLDGLRDEYCPNPISKDKLVFSFDVIFDMSNENEKLPIPLVEILLGMQVYEDANLGVMCVSFCDPEEEDCTPKTNAEGACEIDDAEDVQTAADFIPTVEELTNLAEAVATARGQSAQDAMVLERAGEIGARPEQAIGVQTLRGGDNPGEHTVYFIGGGERVELTHRAATRGHFARGAVRAAAWIVGKAPGLYRIEQVLGLD